jgi:hypothetical protein
VTDDLAKFLRARLDEDEQVARSACGATIEATESLWEAKYLSVHAVTSTSTSAELPAELADHIARQDPARTLAEVDAKREVVRLAERAYDYHGTFMNGFASALVHALRLFALPYAGHPDYRPEWAPEA